ncbi:hypothetical protein BG004_006329 [Podila humilis]|nr:hypothetical protein BG004_006329 [Podila humilis]
MSYSVSDKYRQILQFPAGQWDLTSSRLFIVLPTTVDHNHRHHHLGAEIPRFRLYFLCENTGRKPPLSSSHIHLADHPGYLLNQQHEFLQEYGDYVLRVLELIKYGYSDEMNHVLPLESLAVMQGHGAVKISHGLHGDDGDDEDDDDKGLSLENKILEVLVNRAIAYLRDLELPRWTSYTLSPEQSAAIISFLQLPNNGDSGYGNLDQYFLVDGKSARWLCNSHAPASDMGPPTIRAMIHGIEDDDVDITKSHLSSSFSSMNMASTFIFSYSRSRQVVKISIKLEWMTTKLELSEICHRLVRIGGISVLEIDGFTANGGSQNRIQLASSLFKSVLTQETEPMFVALLNYPRSQDLSCYVLGLGILLNLSEPCTDNTNLYARLKIFADQTKEPPIASQYARMTRHLHTIARHYDIPEFTVFQYDWSTEFQMQKGGFVELSSSDIMLPKIALPLHKLQRISLTIIEPSSNSQRYMVLRQCKILEELFVWSNGHHALPQIDLIAQACDSINRPLLLTLAHRVDSERNAILAQGIIGLKSSENDSFGSDELNGVPFRLQSSLAYAFMGLEPLYWHCAISDLSAFYLRSSVNPLALVSLTLNISRLSPLGVAAIQAVLKRSMLEHLHVICTPVGGRQSPESVSCTLESIQWSTLKSLVVSGGNINRWLEIWPLNTDYRLLRIDIAGTETSTQNLSHTSVLVVHRWVCAFPLTELVIEGVAMQYALDWLLVLDGLDFSRLGKLTLCNRGLQQIIATPVVQEKFLAALDIENDYQTTTQLTLSSFSFDTAQLQLQRFDLFLSKVLCRSRIRDLTIVCSLLVYNNVETMIRQWHSLPWSSLRSLTLRVDNIDCWIELMARTDNSSFTSAIFNMRGSSWPTPRPLSRASAKILQEIYNKSNQKWSLSLVNLYPQDFDNWELEGIDLAFLERIGLLQGDIHHGIVWTAPASCTFDISALQYGVDSCTAQLQRVTLRNLQILSTLSWGAIKTLTLTGQSINDWLTLWPINPAAVTIKSLEWLEICGTSSSPQKLSKASVARLSLLIPNSPVTVEFRNIGLESPENWVDFIEGLGRQVKCLNLCMKGQDQLLSSYLAIALYDSRGFGKRGDMAFLRRIEKRLKK